MYFDKINFYNQKINFIQDKTKDSSVFSVSLWCISLFAVGSVFTMKIYLDNCALQRPLDSKTQVQIILEAEAVLSVLSWCQSGSLELVASDALVFEVERNPNPTRREYALAALAIARHHIALSEVIEQRARALCVAGIKPLDALHLAFAEVLPVDYFCTCDDRLLRSAGNLPDLQVKVVLPLELIGELEL